MEDELIMMMSRCSINIAKTLRSGSLGVLFIVIALLLAVSFSSSHAQTAPRPPEQPAAGPGGSDYRYAGVSKTLYGEGATSYWLYEPRDPTPVSAPVVIFLHGWSGVNPEVYEAWIHHLVRKHRIVVYPVYQQVGQTPASQTMRNAIIALQAAFTELTRPGHVQPETDKVAVVGHSFGGMMAANYAVVAHDNNLPAPKAVMSVEPGGPMFLVEDYSQIAAGTLMLCILGDRDFIVPDQFATMIFNRSTGIAQADKDLILMRSDGHGEPDLIADHFAPLSRLNGSGIDALDWYGLWKWMDALSDAAFYGLNRESALGGTPEQQFMGLWSDGQPVAAPEITD
jgi:pimeloyl-ACP methyl ester carboxylesterase